MTLLQKTKIIALDWIKISSFKEIEKQDYKIKKYLWLSDFLI